MPHILPLWWRSKLTADEDSGFKFVRDKGASGFGREGLLDLAGRGGGRLAAHAGRVDWFGRDQIQVLVVWDLVEAVAVFQQLDVQILIDLLRRERSRWVSKELDPFRDKEDCCCFYHMQKYYKVKLHKLRCMHYKYIFNITFLLLKSEIVSRCCFRSFTKRT